MMMNIRARILSLALVTFAAVIAAFYIEYSDIQRKTDAVEKALIITNKLHSISELIHSLQKERGLSVTHLVGHNDELHSLFLKQCTITDSMWNKLESYNIFTNNKFIINFSSALDKTRQQIASGNIDWYNTRSFYTSAIQNLLELQIIEISSIEHSEKISYELQAIFYLASAKENLGLVRATVNQGYAKENLSADELEYLIQRYGSFFDYHKIFKAISKIHFNTTNDSIWSMKVKEDVYYSLISNIDTIINSRGKVFPDDILTWWNEATIIIDSLKGIEDAIFIETRSHLSIIIKEYKDYLFWYAVLSFIALITVISLTFFAIKRILDALYILIGSLDRLECTQDFSLRICTKSRDEFDQICCSINNLLDYTDKIIKEKDLLATTDLLTGAMNRRSFIVMSENEIKRSERYNTHYSIIFCDIDLFKLINDEYSHSTGDRVLQEFTKTIMNNLRTNDHVSRWGGEEFLISATETDLASAEQLAQKLRKKIMELSVKPVEHVTCSFGVAQRIDGESFADLCERADKALYQAKDNGRNKVCVSEPKDSDKAYVRCDNETLSIK